MRLNIAEQEALLKAGLNKGALGGKLSGAGGGGAFYLITEDYDHLKTLADSLKQFTNDLPTEIRPLIQALVWNGKTSHFV